MSQLRSRAELEVAVDELHSLDEQRAACALFLTVWGRSGADSPLAPELVRAIGHAGGYVAGAKLDGELVGASVGFLGLDNGQPSLHSHITGIHPTAQGRGVGAALKAHQRRWAAIRGLSVITWTFDPLVRRNGRFNLQTLGARAVEYLPDFYGPLADSLNGDDPTDRCLVRWSVVPEVARSEPDFGVLTAAGAEVVLSADDHDLPVATASSAAVRLCWVPEDIVALRSRDRDAAAAWRFALRATLGKAMADGLIAQDMSRDGWYVLTESAAS